VRDSSVQLQVVEDFFKTGRLRLRTRARCVEIRRPLLMGILNINNDSFSRDGSLDPGWAIDRAAEMVREGADIIDVGGESARTNRTAISETEEIDRVGPFVEAFAQMAQSLPSRPGQLHPPLLSINTWRPNVAREILKRGGDILNDMSGLPTDENARICAEADCALLIMHSVGEPKVAHTHVVYDDVLAAVGAFFEEKIALAVAAGVPRESLILDPGIDFAKPPADNLTLLRELPHLSRFGLPLLLPISRKSTIGRVLDIPDPRDRDAATCACLAVTMQRGASIFRVHHVPAMRMAREVLEWITASI